jgi:glycosyltransferase involved in cell wall biosynthesis
MSTGEPIFRTVGLADLPPAPAGKTGWPWTQAGPPTPAAMPDGTAWPALSIIMPSFNQGEYLEHALRSVLLQGYPKLEFIVVDGGSTDGTADLLAAYGPHLAQVRREATSGQADALNRGLEAATSEIVAFLSSDDFYLPGAFAAAARALHETKADLIYGTCLMVDQAGRELFAKQGDVASLDDMLDFKSGWRLGREFMPQAVFYQRARLLKTGAFDTKIAAFQYAHWCRMLAAGASFRRIDAALGCFRFQPEQRSQLVMDTSYEEFLNLIEPWLWDARVPISAARRTALQREWIHQRRFIPAMNLSREKKETAAARWMGTVALCLRYPVFIPELPTVKRLRERMAGGPKDPGILKR